MVHKIQLGLSNILMILTDIGETVALPLLAAALFCFGERLGCGDGPKSRSGGVHSLGVELVGGEGSDNHQNSPPFPLSVYCLSLACRLEGGALRKRCMYLEKS